MTTDNAANEAAIAANNDALISAGMDPVEFNTEIGSPAAADTDGGINILSPGGRVALRGIESDRETGGLDSTETEESGPEDTISDDSENSGIKDSYYSRHSMYAEESKRKTRETLVGKFVDKEYSPSKIKDTVTDLATFIETGEHVSPKEKGLQDEIHNLKSDADSLDEFLAENFPREFAKRISSIGLVRELLTGAFDLTPDGEDDDADV